MLSALIPPLIIYLASGSSSAAWVDISEFSDRWSQLALSISLPKTTLDDWDRGGTRFKVGVATILNHACQCALFMLPNETHCPLSVEYCREDGDFDWFDQSDIQLLPHYPEEHTYSIDVKFLVFVPILTDNETQRAVPRNELIETLRPNMGWLQNNTGLILGTLPPRKVGGLREFLQTWALPLGIFICILMYCCTRSLVEYIEAFALRQATRLKMMKDAKFRRKSVSSEDSDEELSSWGTDTISSMETVSTVTSTYNEIRMHQLREFNSKIVDAAGDPEAQRALLANAPKERMMGSPQSTVVNKSPKVKPQFRQERRNSAKKQVMMMLKNFHK